MSVEGTLTGSWPSWRFSPFAYNGPMFAWIFWLWSEWKNQVGSPFVIRSLVSNAWCYVPPYVSLPFCFTNKSIHHSWHLNIEHKIKPVVEDPSNLNPICHQTAAISVQPRYAARLPPLQYSKNKCSFSGPQKITASTQGSQDEVKKKSKQNISSRWSTLSFSQSLKIKKWINGFKNISIYTR